MITAQRGFQANSRVISTADSMLEELVNLKRYSVALVRILIERRRIRRRSAVNDQLRVLVSADADEKPAPGGLFGLRPLVHLPMLGV